MKTNLITRSGYERLQQELQHLWRVERRETVEKVSWAASLGDRSENADYKYNKQKLRKIDSRIRYLTKRIEQVKVVDYSPQQDGKVFFGAWVEIEDEDGHVRAFQIVGPDEIYDRKNAVSIDSPMARALLKKQVDDEAEVHTPQGTKVWLINKISYQQPA
ncbi:transcription elongation factor GreB [Idiomarina sp. OT37-5b]|jgi:transcription elongation factor GreB|uniref:transcription elongation factor GreB n=1 Tax=Idiomarina sp. OT37-5b TaxID=2100422 RepID=UPI000CF9018D|nr:transcription elongation factor GreB [Idiomarina sp. OT37-5b]AVJ55011.1 transcription elongation factor GreB [Idiomarina sp. OT37-5b]